MEYNYYPGQSIPPHQSQMSNQLQQIGGPIQETHTQMIHGPMPPQSRQNMPPSHLPIQQQIGHHHPHPQQQQQHMNYHPSGPSHTHSGHQLTQSNSTHQSQVSQQHTMQSPHPHINQGSMHMSPQHQLNPIGRPLLGPSPVINHPQPDLHLSSNQNSNFIGGPVNVGAQQHHQFHQSQTQQQRPSTQLNQPMIQHPPHSVQPPHHFNSMVGRHSPYYQSMSPPETRIMEFNRRLQSRPFVNRQLSITPLPFNSQQDESAWWEKFANEFFENDATLTLIIQNEEKPITYKIGRTLIPRFFRSYFDGGVTDLSINLRNPKEIVLSPNSTLLECELATIVTNNIIKHPSLQHTPKVVVHTDGELRLKFNVYNEELSIKSWVFNIKYCREYIDRSMLSMIMPNSIEITKAGLTKATLFYLKMCMIIEPMQDIMSLHKQTKDNPSTCLKNFLQERYNYNSNSDNRAQTNKRRKRKPSATNNNSATTKKSKTNSNIGNSNNTNNNTLNNIVISPISMPSVNLTSTTTNQAPNFPLVSQDVMVVGEPSLMGGDFGDDNERLITRMENTEYDPTASSNTEADNSTLPVDINQDNGLEFVNVSNINDVSNENQLSPSLINQNQSTDLQLQSQQESALSQTNQITQDIQPSQNVQQPSQDSEAVFLAQSHVNEREKNSYDTIKSSQTESSKLDLSHVEKIGKDQNTPQDGQKVNLGSTNDPTSRPNDFNQNDNISPISRNSNGPPVSNVTNNNNMKVIDENESNINNIGLDPDETSNNHGTSVQISNEADTNSQPNINNNGNAVQPCSNTTQNPSIEQQQPVNNSVA